MSAQPVAAIDVAAADAAGWPVVIGVPFPRGAQVQVDQLCAVDDAGKPCPTAAEVLTTWPDGSPRWVLLSLLATRTGRHTVESRADKPTPAQPVRVEQLEEGLVLDNGLVRLVLGGGGPGPIHQLSAAGREWLEKPEHFRLMVDEADTTHETARNLTVLYANPLRARVRIEGKHRDASGKRKLHYRLDVELWAGWPTLRTDYQFLNKEPGQDELPVRRIALHCDYPLGAATRRRFLQTNHGVFYRSRLVENPAPVALVSDDQRSSVHVEHPDMLLDDVDYPYYLSPPLVETPNWLGVTDGAHSVYAAMQEMAQLRPKRLASEGGALTLEVWPTRAGVLSLRQGRSRRSVFCQVFVTGDGHDAGTVTHLLDAPLPEDRATVDPAWVAHCREFQQHLLLPARQHLRMEKWLARIMNLVFTETMFDFGDTPDSGYSQTYIPSNHQVPLQPGAPTMTTRFTTDRQISKWSMPQRYQPVWTNNEYDCIHAFCSEILRTGKETLWPIARRLMRHNFEVDLVHYSDHQWINRGTPQHSVDHVTSGCVPSHMWTQGMLEYYCLTGDVDAREFAIAMGDKILENFNDPVLGPLVWNFTRESGWPMLALSYLGDVLGEPRFEEVAGKLAKNFASFDFHNPAGKVKLSGVNPRNTYMAQVMGSFFGFACMVEGLDHYLQRHPEETQIKTWLVSFLNAAYDALEFHLRDGRQSHITHMQTFAMALGYEYTGDERFLRLGVTCLQEWIESTYFAQPTPEVKPVAMVHRGLVRFLGHAHRAGLLDQLEYPLLRQ